MLIGFIVTLMVCVTSGILAIRETVNVGINQDGME